MPVNNANDEYFNLGTWVSKKFNYQKKSKNLSVKRLQVNVGEVWFCDLGVNIGTEKNKVRPVLVVSNNRINSSEKVVIISITDTQGKLNQRDLPAQDSWYLLYSNTTDNLKKLKPNRVVPNNNIIYSFLDKDSVVQCEEIRVVSKARLDSSRGAIGVLDPQDLRNIKDKFLRAYNFWFFIDKALVLPYNIDGKNINWFIMIKSHNYSGYEICFKEAVWL